MLRYLSCFLMANLLFNAALYAQEVKGTVADWESREPQEYVEVFNLNNHQKTVTNKRGEFKIAAEINHLLVFFQPGYKPDTLLLISLKPVKRYLQHNRYDLSTVKIQGKLFDPRVQYADAFREAKAFTAEVNRPLTFSPFRFFSKKGKSGRKFKRRMEVEVLERKVDQRFNNAAVQALCPLEGAELDGFMVLYRPSFKALERLDNAGLKLYIMDAYKEFKQLPEEKKKIPSLKL
ncbi:peptidase associated/transthyretin-like domain-containing protein [Pedobacter gandavensis]|uniref:Carboxypeptidase-like regulatory domain-containing protein n=1 Tax=Pedobacter gandavensis TaxID=2679963 RepID=A0ABR6ESK3_9SPHI|nr:hypothetical protein [Pedobacter gandavensis]MBB2148234.1 hypothetical protein [Pedobacter gandavensis]